MNYQTLTSCYIIFVGLFTASLSRAHLENEDVVKLNSILGKKYNLMEWKNLKRLHLEVLPKEQFPEAFDKLTKLEIIDLLPESGFSGCVEKQFGASRVKNLENFYKDQEICLSGRKFFLRDKKGAGKMASVYIIEDPVTKMKYAFTRYNYTGANSLGAKLVLSNARISQNLLNMPLLVNTKEDYLISPLMMGDHVIPGSAEMNRFYPGGGCELLIRQDNIWSGHDWHMLNYMYATKESKLPIAIDFRTFNKEKNPWIPAYGPEIRSIDKDPEHCKKLYEEQATKEKAAIQITKIQPEERLLITPATEQEKNKLNKESCAKLCFEKSSKCLLNQALQTNKNYTCGKRFSQCFKACK